MLCKRREQQGQKRVERKERGEERRGEGRRCHIHHHHGRARPHGPVLRALSQRTLPTKNTVISAYLLDSDLGLERVAVGVALLGVADLGEGGEGKGAVEDGTVVQGVGSSPHFPGAAHGDEHLGIALLEARGAVGNGEDAEGAADLAGFRGPPPVDAEAGEGEELGAGLWWRGVWWGTWVVVVGCEWYARVVCVGVSTGGCSERRERREPERERGRQAMGGPQRKCMGGGGAGGEKMSDGDTVGRI